MKIETFFKPEKKIYGSDPLNYLKSWSTPLRGLVLERMNIVTPFQKTIEKKKYGSILNALFRSHETRPLQVLKEIKIETVFNSKKRSYESYPPKLF